MKKSHITAPKAKTESKNDYSKSTKIILIFIIVISLGVLFSTIAYTIHKVNYYNKIIRYTVINVSLEVSRNPGLNGDTDGLMFGKVPPGATGIRYVDINTTEPAKVTIYIGGEIAKYISVDDNEFYMGKNESKRLPVYAHIPNVSAYRNYYGVLTIALTKP